MVDRYFMCRCGNIVEPGRVELGLKNMEDNASVPNILPFGEEKQANG